MLAVSEIDASALCPDKTELNVMIQLQRCRAVPPPPPFPLLTSILCISDQSERVISFQAGVEFRTLSLCIIKCKYTFFHIRLIAEGGG